jgi:serine/threonine protein kinase
MTKNLTKIIFFNFKIEIATGKHPFENLTVFGLINTLKHKESPHLDSSKYTNEFCSFVDKCLIKQSNHRASVNQLFNQEFILTHFDNQINLSYIQIIISQIRSKIE